MEARFSPGTGLLPAGVWVDEQTAYLVATALAPKLRQLRNDGYRLDPKLEAAYAAYQVAGERWKADAPAFRRKNTDVQAAGDAGTLPVVHRLSVLDVAERLGVTPRAVAARAARGTLPGRKFAGVWTFDPADLAGHLTDRSAS